MYELPNLPYNYDALEPVISEDIMRLHHQKHHKAYVDKLNQALLDGGVECTPIVRLLSQVSSLPDSVKTSIVNNGGGHYNHSRFWEWMTPTGSSKPKGKLLADLTSKYGSFQNFVEEFTLKATSLFGSGWVWLMPDLTIVSTENQNNPIMKGMAEPILGLDVWEHAYYLDYKNVRADYIAAWWKGVNWQEVERDYLARV